MRASQAQETDQEKALKIAAEEQAIQKTQDRAGRETDMLFRRYGMSLRGTRIAA
jgi:hypothetical protein